MELSDNSRGTGSTVMELSDKEVVVLVRAGDVDAYRLLVERHYATALRVAARMLDNHADAEEAVQDAFARGYRFLNRFDETRSFKSWLFGILMNCCRNALASRIRSDHVVLSMDPHSAQPSTVWPDGEKERVMDVGAALMQLDPVHRETLLLKFADDWTYEQIAELTGTRVSALKMRVKRARAQLVALLGRDFNAN
jgi:RNA polymerase sigma-70 factor (ECF subfamily)